MKAGTEQYYELENRFKAIVFDACVMQILLYGTKVMGGIFQEAHEMK